MRRAAVVQRSENHRGAAVAWVVWSLPADLTYRSVRMIGRSSHIRTRGGKQTFTWTWAAHRPAARDDIEGGGGGPGGGTDRFTYPSSNVKSRGKIGFHSVSCVKQGWQGSALDCGYGSRDKESYSMISALIEGPGNPRGVEGRSSGWGAVGKARATQKWNRQWGRKEIGAWSVFQSELGEV